MKKIKKIVVSYTVAIILRISGKTNKSTSTILYITYLVKNDIYLK